jgi:hypothetical protein
MDSDRSLYIQEISARNRILEGTFCTTVPYAAAAGIAY